MAYSNIEYTTNSSANAGKNYTYSFGAVAHDTTNIKVSIGGVVLTSSQYSVVQGTITLTTAPGGGSAPFDAVLSASNVLKVYRETNRTTAEIVFSANSIIQDEDLNTANDQARYLALEAVDRASEAMVIDADDTTQYDIQISGADKRIYGVEDPTNANDAANKEYVDAVAMGSGASVVSETGTQELTNKTLTSPVINTGVSGSAILDSDSMSGATSTTLSSSESIKAYVDALDASIQTYVDTQDAAIASDTLEFTNKTFDADGTGNVLTNIEVANLKAGVIDPDISAVSVSDDTIPSAKAVKTYVDSSGLSIIDEDNMATDSAIRPPSQQSVKAYVNSEDVLMGYQAEPHIIPNVLHPAVDGVSYNGANLKILVIAGEYAWGDVFDSSGGDNLRYYYTDIKGSKPIKEPRIGAHFGSQRHTFSSIQLLEQETATEGENVFSIDGREWLRAVDGTGTWNFVNNADGPHLEVNSDATGAFFEVTGYFNDINFITDTAANRVDAVKLTVNGTVSATSGSVGGRASVDSPLGSRYVDAGSLQNQGSTLATSLGTTPKINTLKYEITSGSSEYLRIYGIELIAQEAITDATCDYNNDPTITHDDDDGAIRAGMSVTGTGIPVGATVASVTSDTEFELSASTTGGSVTNGTLTFGQSNIQIPSQNVVSYGKKFSVSGTPHYDPFNGFTSGNLAAVQALGIDTDTSLGLSKWLPSDATSTYYRPFNGGRVIKWVDSSGTIKTSVNMMPPNAKSIANSASPTNAFATRTTASHFGTNDAMNSFEAGTDLDSDQLAEVAKTFMTREFGNGSANGNATYADISTVQGDADVAYVMDDGLTSMSGNLAYDTYQSVKPHSPGSLHNLTFIGTGLTLRQEGNSHTGIHTIAQNLPYGTHILSAVRDASTATDTPYKLDGVQLFTGFLDIAEVTIHQPKRPPIPEDAVVLADYMLMADFVKQTDADDGQISKGVRGLSGTRDVLYNASSDLDRNTEIDVSIAPWGFVAMAAPGSTNPGIATLPFFGTNAVVQVQERTVAHTIDFAGSTDVDKTGLDNSTTSYGDKFSIDDDAEGNPIATLGLNTITTNILTGGYRFSGYYLATPIHTSSHYQSFETPFLHELVGGDRNMEQTNLIVTPDGKSWDEVTRDTSYIGKVVMQTSGEIAASIDDDSIVIFDEWRGMDIAGGPIKGLFNKDFAIAYDRLICLVNGQYKIEARTVAPSSGHGGYLARIYINDENAGAGHGGTSGYSQAYNAISLYLKRGDVIQIYGDWNSSETLSGYKITKL